MTERARITQRLRRCPNSSSSGYLAEHCCSSELAFLVANEYRVMNNVSGTQIRGKRENGRKERK